MTDLLYIMKHTCTNRDGCDRNNNFKKRSINACGHVTRPIVSPPSLASYGVRVFYLFSLSVYSQCIHHIRLLAHCLFSCQSRHFDFSGSFILSSFHVVIRFIIFLNQRTRLNWTSSSVNLLHLPSHFASREKSFDFISWILCFDRSIDGHCLIENFVFCIFLFLICGSFSVVACIMRQQLSETHYPPGRRINRKKKKAFGDANETVNQMRGGSHFLIHQSQVLSLSLQLPSYYWCTHTLLFRSFHSTVEYDFYPHMIFK